MVRILQRSRLLVGNRGGGFCERVAILQLFLFLPLSAVWPVSASNEFLIGLGDFNDSNMRCSTGVGSGGILQMAPNADTPPYVAGGRCLFNGTIKLLDSTRTRVSSFSTTFTFSMYNADAAQNSQSGSAVVGFAFIMVAEPRPEIGYDINAQGLQYLGILNETSSGKNSSHTFAVKFGVYDSRINRLFNDPSYDSVGILLNNMNASSTSRAGTYAEKISCEKRPSVPEYRFVPMNLSTGRLLQAWIDYEAQSRQLSVSISSQLGMKPTKALLKETIDLSPIVQEAMYVGFSSAGNADGEKTPSLVYSWSFNVSGRAPLLYPDSTSARCGPGPASSYFSRTSLSNVYVSVISSLALLVCMLFLLGFVLTRQKRALRKEFQLLELENLEYGPIKYTYRALRAATDGFDTSKSLARGGWGSFFKAVLGASGREVAVKRISRMSKSSETEFIAEVRIIGRLRHRNLVQLQGWCYHRQDLLLVYELLPFGSLDHFLFEDDSEALPWHRRLQILKGVATALVYLHEECQLEKTLVHGNVKASNVMLDSEYNARLGDFGLTRFYEENQQKADNTAAGTCGRYSSMYRPSSVKFTEKSDVQSFGALMLHVATGRRPVEPASLPPEDRSLFRWTKGLYLKNKLLEAVDRRLGNDYCEEELLTVLRIGLLCCHSDPGQRPSMRSVKQMLCGESSIPPLPSVRSGGTVASGRPDCDESLREYAAPEISLIDSPEVGLIANFKGIMGDRASSRDSMGKRSRSYGS